MMQMHHFGLMRFTVLKTLVNAIRYIKK